MSGTSTTNSSASHCWLTGLRKASSAKVLVVGAGGIGCELLKNLVLAGFHNLVVIDLDTIDVTNLNRQFLFHKEHVGQSKALVAKESVEKFNPKAKVQAIKDSIMSHEYGVSYFKEFDLVLDALDNRAARSHVNRMCLAADVPLVESGTAGYLGQVTVIRKKSTECYECTPKPHQKTFPSCTIRNTPSEMIHCVVWAKHLFNQLFGESDPDEDVSPDNEDPEARGDGEAGETSNNKKDGSKNGGGPNDSAPATPAPKISTRQWAKDKNYDAEALFNRLFGDDIRYLLSMDKLWAKRRPPEPLDWSHLPEEVEKEGEIHDQTVWNMEHCARKFKMSVAELQKKLQALTGEDDHLVWDKDEVAAMDFVAACANLRAQVFHIEKRSRFDLKSMAGNIIPAIATTNAVIAGMIVMEAIKLLGGDADSCKTVYLTRKPNPRSKILVPCQLNPPNPSCYVCSKNEVSVKVDLNKMTVKAFEEKVVKKSLNMVEPDVEIEGRGVILISSEAGETADNEEKTLAHFNLVDGSILVCDDFLQEYKLRVFLYHGEKFEDGEDFEILSEIPQAPEATDKNSEAGEKSKEAANGQANSLKRKSEPSADPISPSPAVKRPREVIEEDNEIVCLE